MAKRLFELNMSACLMPSDLAPSDVRFWHKADIPSCAAHPLLGVKRTSLRPLQNLNGGRCIRFGTRGTFAAHHWLRSFGSGRAK
jgi:hypothetical protein